MQNPENVYLLSAWLYQKCRIYSDLILYHSVCQYSDFLGIVYNSKQLCPFHFANQAEMLHKQYFP